MTQNIREEFDYQFPITSFRHIGDIEYAENEREELYNFFISHHNTTLKEIEGEVESKRVDVYDGGEAVAEDGEYVRVDDIKQLIHQKLI